MNRKLTLDLDALTVKSFETMDEPAEVRGTVKAHGEGPACPWSQPLSCPATLHTCSDA